MVEWIKWPVPLLHFLWGILGLVHNEVQVLFTEQTVLAVLLKLAFLLSLLAALVHGRHATARGQLTAPTLWSLKPSHWFRELSRQRILPHSLAMVFHFSIHSLLNVDGKIHFIVHLNTNIWNLLSPWLQFFSLHNLQTIRRLSGNCGGVAWRLDTKSSTILTRIYTKFGPGSF